MRVVANPNYSLRSEPTGGFKSFEAFYPFYLGEHCNRTNRRLHLIGTTISVILFLVALLKRNKNYFFAGILQGYVWAWTGHFIFEKNKPATFRYPIWSLWGDFKMWSEIGLGKRAL
ncbi:hypothetical protein CLU79DRAFT_739020 [Phycomyces nitens]|nr:hypothetical protein CLU79DRAFT_739020 [Phycomyces nitens]